VTGNLKENCALLGYYALSSGEYRSQLFHCGKLKSHVAIRLVTRVRFPEKAGIFLSAATSLVAWNAATLLHIAAISSCRGKAAR
jgi:hypothetical protein